MQLTDVLCYALLTITMAATCIQAENNVNDSDERKLSKRISRTTTLVVDSAVPVERMFQKPKVIYRKLAQKRHASPGAYGPRRTKYGPTRTMKKPAKKIRSKGSAKHATSSHKKRASRPKYGPPKRPTMKPVYGPPKIGAHRLYNNIAFKEPLNSFSHSKYRPPKSKEYFRQHPDSDSSPKPNIGYDLTSKPGFYDDYSSKPNIGFDISSPTSFSEDLLNQPFSDDYPPKPQLNDYRSPTQEYEETHSGTNSPNQGYGEPPLDSYVPKQEYGKPPSDSYVLKQGYEESSLETYVPKHGYGEPPVDSYGAPIKPNLRDLTFSTAQTFHKPTTHNSKNNYESNSELWKIFKDLNSDDSVGYVQNIEAFKKPEAEIFITPIPDKHNEEQHLNSYSDIYNYRQIKEKKKGSYFDNVKIVNQPWKGAKMKGDSNEEIVVGGQYAEPPARYIPKFQSSAPMFSNDENVFSPALQYLNHDDKSAAVSSYVNYKNSNMAFSPQNLNDVFSIVDK